MELWYAPSSPFARKVRIAAAECGLPLRLVAVDPWQDARLRALNPLAKVPTLVCDDGMVLFESGVICDYLDSLAPARRLIPPAGAARWHVLKLQGLIDGALTAAGRLFADERRGPGARSEAMMDRFRQSIAASLDLLNEDAAAGRLATERLTLAEICAALLPLYLAFRWPEERWQEGRPALAAWLAQVAARPSIRETAHSLS